MKKVFEYRWSDDSIQKPLRWRRDEHIDFLTKDKLYWVELGLVMSDIEFYPGHTLYVRKRK